MNTKKVEITLTATTAVQYTEVVAVPVDISDAELNALVNERYTTVGADEFIPVPGDWERGDCGALDAQPDADATVAAIRVPGGMLVQEAGSAEYGGLPAEQEKSLAKPRLDAIANPAPRRPDGWALIAANGTSSAFHPRVRSFFGATLDDDAPKFDAEWIAREDRENPGDAPHTCVEVFFETPNQPPASEQPPAEEARP